MHSNFVKYGLGIAGLIALIAVWELSLEPIVIGWHTHPKQKWLFAFLGMALAALALIPPIIAILRSHRARIRAETSLRDVVDNLEETVRERTAAYERLNTQLAREVADHVTSADLLRDVTENIREVFWVSSPDGAEILYVSPAYEDIWGATVSSLKDNPGSFYAPLHPDDRDKRRLIPNRADRTVDQSYRIMRPDGSVRWIRDRSYPVADAQGNIKRVVGIAEDITQVKALQANLLHAQRLEAVGTLAGGIAHDFNNLLATILVSAGTLRLKTDPADARIRNIGDITFACKQGATLVTNLLRFARAEQTSKQTIPLRSLILETTSVARATFDRRITLGERIETDLWNIHGDPGQIHQLLMNLLINGRDAILANPSNYEGTLTVAAQNVILEAEAPELPADGTPGRYVEVSVTDDGIGIPEPLKNQVFDPFFSTKEPGHGTGLGLATVHGIVGDHGGGITLDSHQGVGTTFRIHLPVNDPGGMGETPAPAPTTPPGSEDAPHPAPSILVVESEARLRQTLADHLRGKGYPVQAVCDARHARHALNAAADREAALELVILDLMLPGTRGWELLREINKRYPALSIIVMGGYAESDTEREAAVTYQGRLEKPFSLGELEREVGRVLKARRT